MQSSEMQKLPNAKLIDAKAKECTRKANAMNRKAKKGKG